MLYLINMQLLFQSVKHGTFSKLWKIRLIFAYLSESRKSWQIRPKESSRRMKDKSIKNVVIYDEIMANWHKWKLGHDQENYPLQCNQNLELIINVLPHLLKKIGEYT